MAQTCGQCGKSVFRIKLRGKNWIGEDCGCLRDRAIHKCSSQFSDLTLDHVFTETGEKVRVTSLRQLQAAESRYNFASVVGNMEEKNFDTPPQQRAMNVGNLYQWKFDKRAADVYKR